MTDDENLFVFAIRRAQELTSQIAALRGQMALMSGQLAQREYELVRVQEILRAHELQAEGVAVKGVAIGAAVVTGEGVANRPMSEVAQLAQHFNAMTIKELVVRSLLDHFKQGAPAASIRDFIRDAYGRTIEPSSLRPQMHRLKSDSILTHDPATDTWDLTPQKRRHFTWYGFPEQRNYAQELREFLDAAPQPLDPAHPDFPRGQFDVIEESPFKNQSPLALGNNSPLQRK
jgi:hypothetical protein